MHRRVRPFTRRFTHSVFSLYLDLDELSELSRRLPLFSHNRWNIVSFMDRDHGPRDGSPLRPWIRVQLDAAGIVEPCGGIGIFCFPRLFGYVFNPLSVWFCHRVDGGLLAIIHEVKNRRGQQHCYVLPVDRADCGGDVFTHECPKQFHVSPFLATAGTYRFRTKRPGDTVLIGVVHRSQDDTVMTAVQVGARETLSSRRLLATILRMPLLTLKVTLAIHWHAVLLWLRGAPVHGLAAKRAAARFRGAATS
jgi:hypothetical protein